MLKQPPLTARNADTKGSKMSKCNCPENLESMHQLCAPCEADYLRYLDEIQNAEPEDDQTRPATLADVRELERWDFEQHTHTAVAIATACEISHNQNARIIALEANSQAQAQALRACALRIDALAKAIAAAERMAA